MFPAALLLLVQAAPVPADADKRPAVAPSLTRLTAADGQVMMSVAVPATETRNVNGQVVTYTLMRVTPTPLKPDGLVIRTVGGAVVPYQEAVKRLATPAVCAVVRGGRLDPEYKAALRDEVLVFELPAPAMPKPEKK